MVGPVDGECDRVVVYGHVRFAVGAGNTGTCAATAGEKINNQFFLEREAHGRRGLKCGHRYSG